MPQAERQLRYKKQFLKIMARLPASVRSRAEDVAFGDDLPRDLSLGGGMQKLKGYSEYYRLRIGDYRLGVQIDSNKRIVELRRILHHKDIYRKFP